MSILSEMFHKIFGSAAQAAPASTGTPQQAPTPSAGASASTTAAPASVDIAKVLDAAVAKKGEKLDWKHSIVDLMKAIDLDSGLKARQQLAKELNYTGDTNDSAKMNIWLHAQVMKKLADNGGVVPADLKH